MKSNEKQKLIEQAYKHLDEIKLHLDFIFETIKENRKKSA
ncbi:hypothetical protein CRYPA_251 [uncultured Candidatus Thioglobus sp.]|jgi:hypothetical protein|nr:hypothetical protein [uncultured Gammaproteobacteria bacterium]SMN16466.1 hypothetical protein CRYPA_251 [uncultured Candidatus Thioglobus sp.]CAC9564950.1 hypothetical protein [uncultured Gammaproteobacteria bacterium]CAC9575071.1 hypothetical protein [uncultured Gammaproteobacteria bacterium]CAC9578646.1 hypothetical protein [uncultured Gammaproteobacteria bacterium]